ncbi:MAG: calcium/sodium antiporter [Porphyromonas sp.]|nr:calcium/sodium antiporter [Porphyromonas sp.]
MQILLLVVGVALVVVGANGLTEGASAVSKRFNISDLVIGLTVVAFGTSAPELSVSVISALKGSNDIALGNVMGSNIFNILVILGLTALITPVSIGKTTRNKEMPFALFAAVLLALIVWAPWAPGAVEDVSRIEGLILLIMGLAFVAYTVWLSKQYRKSKLEEGRAEDVSASTGTIALMPIWKSIAYIVGGLAALIYGGNLFVEASTFIAKSLGISEAVIGLTLVAAGTSLPELATSIVASMKGKPEIAVGNVVGSNIFNIFLVLGTSAVIKPMSGLTFTNIDVWIQVLSMAIVWIFAKFLFPGEIKRWQGAVLFLIYVIYTLYLIYAA